MPHDVPSLVSIMGQAVKLNKDLARGGDGLKIPDVADWKTSSGVALSDPDYLRAYHLARAYLMRWWTKKNPRHTLGRRDRKKLFDARLPYFCHLAADYALWCRVPDDLRPKDWPQTTTAVARLHGISLGELSILLHRVSFKRFIQRLYPPIPSYLFIERLDQKVMKHALREDLWEKSPDKARALAELAYKRYGVIKTGGGGIQIQNNNNVEAQRTREGTNEEELAKALALVAPYLPKLLPAQEVPLAEEESVTPLPDHQPAAQGSESGPAGDGET